MALLSLDLGGTKLATALFSESGEIKTKHTLALKGSSGKLVGEMITNEIKQFLDTGVIESIGVAVPGIYSPKTGTVWAPNIPGWDNYPLLEEIKSVSGDIPVTIESDRACYITGEIWRGNAQGCTDAIYMAVGTGIGAGIVSGNHLIRGVSDIAGAIGWMALDPEYQNKYDACGCFEYHASGEGIKKVYNERLKDAGEVTGRHNLTAHEIFEKYDLNDPIADMVIEEAIRYWGMAVANLVSLFNPQKIIIGGGVFGPASKLLDRIGQEAKKWAQPISMSQVEITASALGSDAGLYGAACLAQQAVLSKKLNNAV